MKFKQWLRLRFTDELLGEEGEDIEYYCPVCKKKTIHTEHGFRQNNYRLECSKCDAVNLYED